MHYYRSTCVYITKLLITTYEQNWFPLQSHVFLHFLCLLKYYCVKKSISFTTLPKRSIAKQNKKRLALLSGMARREEEGGESKRNKGEEGVGRGRERERKGNGESSDNREDDKATDS